MTALLLRNQLSNIQRNFKIYKTTWLCLCKTGHPHVQSMFMCIAPIHRCALALAEPRYNSYRLICLFGSQKSMAMEFASFDDGNNVWNVCHGIR